MGNNWKFKLSFCFALLFLALLMNFALAERLPAPGGDKDNWGDILNAYLQREHTESGSHHDVNVEGSLNVVDNAGDTSLAIDPDNGNIGIGTNSPSARLEVAGNTFTSGQGDWITKNPVLTSQKKASAQEFETILTTNTIPIRQGTVVMTQLNLSNSTALDYWDNFRATANFFGATPVNKIIGSGGQVVHRGSATLPLAIGVQGAIDFWYGTGTAAAITDARIINARSASRVNNRGTIANLYGLYVDEQTLGTNNWAVYTAGNTPSYFGGKVKIGTIDPLLGSNPIPATDLHVVGRMFIDNSGGNHGVVPGPAFVIDGAPDKDIVLFRDAGGNNKFVIGSTGNVGIGTTVPKQGYMLDVNGDLRVRSDVNGLVLQDSSKNDRWSIYTDVTDTGDISFFDYGSATDRLVIRQTTGNVGIGTINPTQKLDVAGNIHATGDICTDAGGTPKCLSTAGGSGGGGSTQFSTSATGTAYTNNKVAVGTDFSNVGDTMLDVYQAQTSTANGFYPAISGWARVNVPAVGSGARVGGAFKAELVDGSQNIDTGSSLLGSLITSANSAGQKVPTMIGLQTGVEFWGSSSAGAVNTYGIWVKAPEGRFTSIDKAISIYLPPVMNGAKQINKNAISKAYAIYQEGANDVNYFAGNVGIGTTNPLTNLHTVGRMFIDNSGGNHGVVPGPAFVIDGAPDKDIVLFRDAGANNKFVINSNGNVGIGIGSPAAKLHVIGDATVTGTLKYGALQALSPILESTHDPFVTRCTVASDGNYVVSYIKALGSGKYEQVVEKVDSNNQNWWHQECYKKIVAFGKGNAFKKE